MNRKTITAALALSAALLLAGCGDDGDDGAKGGKGGKDAPTASASDGRKADDAPAAGDDSSGSGTAEDQEAVRQAMTGFFTALAEADGEAACALLTERAQQEMAASAEDKTASCAETVRTSMELFDDEEIRKGFRSVVVGDVKIDGDKAVVEDAQLSAKEGTFLFEDDDPAPTTLLRQDGRWLMDDDG